MLRHRPSPDATPETAKPRPFWAEVLRALREARGVSQDGWAAWLGVSRKTVQRWEGGVAVPDTLTEDALVALCRERGLLRTYDHGPLRGRTLSVDVLRDLLAEARLGTGPSRTTPAPPISSAATGARLVARSADGRVTSYPLRLPETAIGRGADNDVVIADERVSRYHARITWDGQAFVLQDLGSKNGTLVAGEPLTAPRALRDGDRVALAGRDGLTLTFDAAAGTVTAGTEALPGGGLWVDPRTAEVWRRGQRLAPSPEAARALALLYERAGEVVEPAAIAARAWPGQPVAETGANVAALVDGLRRLIEPDPATPEMLRTEPGGYRLVIA